MADSGAEYIILDLSRYYVFVFFVRPPILVSAMRFLLLPIVVVVVVVVGEKCEVLNKLKQL